MEEELKQAKITVEEVRADHQLINDEHIALHVGFICTYFISLDNDID